MIDEAAPIKPKSRARKPKPKAASYYCTGRHRLHDSGLGVTFYPRHSPLKPAVIEKPSEWMKAQLAAGVLAKLED